MTANRIKNTLLCCLFPLVSLTAQPLSWSLPTPDTGPGGATLIPYPAQVNRTEGEIRFTSLFPDETSLSALPDAARIRTELADIAAFWEMPSCRDEKGCRVRFETVPASSGACDREAYVLTVSEKNVTVAAATYAGYFNALQTLRQLIRKENAGYSIPNCRIADKPAFALRGVMLDVGRNYASTPFIKHMARILSRYKINLLHLHLTDDPAWRVEVKRHPRLTDPSVFWKTRQPGKFYTQAELQDLVDYCGHLNIRVVPEIDMPGHSAAFTRATGTKMQTAKGMKIVQEALDEIVPVFPDSLFHIGSDEVRFEMENFMPDMIRYIRGKGKEVVVWYPGFVPDSNAVLMCWGENEAGYALNKTMKYIDCNGFYLDWMEAEGGVLQTFFQQPCEVPEGNGNALGSIFCVWTDGALSSEQRLLEQYPFYPCALTFAERIWRGSREKRKDLMAKFPPAGSTEWKAIAEFEDRLVDHRDRYFAGIPFPYVKQAGIKWRLIGPFDHEGVNDRSFEPEQVIKDTYRANDTLLRWNDSLAYGGTVQIRNLYALFNMHQGKYRLDHWPTVMSASVGKEGGTCYALAHIDSREEQDVYLMFGLNGMWGHSGGYRTARAPEQGSWDFSGGDIWLNDLRVEPPRWPFESLPWGGWGQGRIEVPLTEEGYFYRPPVKIRLKKGINKIVVRTVFGHWKGDDGQRKWQFCCIPVQWDGCHYTEVNGLEYLDPLVAQ